MRQKGEPARALLERAFQPISLFVTDLFVIRLGHDGVEPLHTRENNG